MTTALAILCKDGIVIGSDLKAVAGDKKWLATKILQEHSLGGRPIIFAGAGAIRHINDAVTWLAVDGLQARTGQEPTFDLFLSECVERNLPSFALDYQSKYNDEPEYEMIVATVEKAGVLRLAEVYSDGQYDHKSTFAAIGSGSVFGEILLRRLYRPSITMAIAKRLIGYLIWEIQSIDNNTGEHMEIICLDKKGKVEVVSSSEIEAYKRLPLLVEPSYEDLNTRISHVNLDEIRKHIDGHARLINQMNSRLTVTLIPISKKPQEGSDDGKTNREAEKRDQRQSKKGSGEDAPKGTHKS